MRCRKQDCPGEYEHRLITRTEMHDGQPVVIENVPAKACPICGETFFSLETAEGLEDLRDDLEQGRAQPAGTAKVYRFGESTSQQVVASG